MTRGDRRYARLLTFYTPRWRAQNGRAVLDTLRDAHAQAGQHRPSMLDAISFARAGITQRLLTPQTSPGAQVTTVLVLLEALGSTAYTALVLWAPGADWAGHLGPFSNPTPIASTLLIVAAVLALAHRDGAARFVSSAAGATVLLMTGFSITGGWVGPSFQVAFGLVGLCLLATRWVWRPIPVVAAVLLVAGPAAVPFFHGLVIYLMRSTDWFGTVWLVSTSAGAAMLLALGWRSPFRAHEGAAPSRGLQAI